MVRLYKLAASQGNANAQCNLGGTCTCRRVIIVSIYSHFCASNILYIDRRPSSIGLYEFGVRPPDVPIGDGVPCDLRAACDLYRAAAAQGHREARRRLTALGENEHPYISVGALGDEVPSGEPRETE